MKTVYAVWDNQNPRKSIESVRRFYMYTQLELSNFRGFKRFSMELKPITLIAGKNNTGKTSILEGLFLFQDYANPDVFIKLLKFRGMSQYDTSARTVWEPLFYDMDTQECLEVRLNGEFSLNLKRNNEFALSNNALGMLDGKIDYSSVNYALLCDFARESKRFSGNYLIGNENMGNNLVLHGPENTSIQRNKNEEFVQYLGPHITLDEITIAEWFGQIELSRNKVDKKKLIDILAVLDEDIVDVTTIAANRLAQLYFSYSQKEKLPIHTIGDGTKKLLHIALVLLANPGCILLLDEVENGLHYSLYSKFWKMISALALQENCQIIATTHNYECINGALEGVKAANLEESFAYVRLDKSDKGVVPKTFTCDMLERALDSDWEVR
ncbi:MAG: ATP-binding protein [Prevotellaceae bacterium]|jgi:AAA15 family ATPase/GTPase|nr:ATP-binding protein [Prevotellaceae bacterium]